MKMTKKYDNLDDAFNVESTVVPESKDQKTDIVKPQSKDDIVKDYEYTRGNLYSVIEKGQEALNGILELAQESEMPRAYEVAGQLIKNVADATDKLMKLQKELKEVQEELNGSKEKVDSTVQLTKDTLDSDRVGKEIMKGGKLSKFLKGYKCVPGLH